MAVSTEIGNKCGGGSLGIADCCNEGYADFDFDFDSSCEIVECSELVTNCIVTEFEVVDVVIRFRDGAIVEVITEQHHVDPIRDYDDKSEIVVDPIVNLNADSFIEDKICDDGVIDQPAVTFPATFVMQDFDIQFGSLCHHGDKIRFDSPGVNNEAFNGKSLELGAVVKDIDSMDIDIQFGSLCHHGVANIDAQLQLDEKIRGIDVIAAEMGRKWEIMRVHNEAFNAKSLELGAATARQSVESKRQHIDHVDRVLNEVKNVIAVKGIDSMINEAEHMCSSDEIEQLKSVHDQLAKDMACQYGIQLALDQKDQIEEHLKDLKKELKILEDDVSKAEVACDTIRETYIEEVEMERDIQAQFIAPYEPCQEETYGHLHSLKKPLNDKVNSTEEFREDYISMCTMLAMPNTLDEPSCVFPDDTDQKGASNTGPTSDEVKSTSTIRKLETRETVKSVEEKHSDDDQVKENVMKNKEAIEPNELICIKEKKNMDELMKENIQLEEKVKISEASERKKLKDEKAQMLAEMQAHKKEKARLKRIRKRERKWAGKDAASSNVVVDENVAGSNKSKDVENTKSKPQHRPPPPHFLSKQLKPKFVPPPPAVIEAIKNRKRRRHWRYMAIIVMILILCFVIFT